MEYFYMKYQDAVTASEALDEYTWERIETYSQEAIDGFNHFVFEAQRAYKYFEEGTQHAYQYGVGLYSDGLSNGALYMKQSLEDVANYVKTHFEVDIPEAQLPDFLYNVGNEIYNFMTDEELPEGGLTTAIVMPVTAIEGALNINVPVDLYQRLKDWIRMHYSEPTANVTVPNGTVYNNVVGGANYNKVVDIHKEHFSKTWLRNTITDAIRRCLNISAERSDVLIDLVVANIDDMYTHVRNALGSYDYVYDFINIQGIESNSYYYWFDVYPFVGESSVDYWKGDYGNQSVQVHADGIQSIELIHHAPNPHPITVTFMAWSSYDVQRNNWQYWGANWSTSDETLDYLDQHNYTYPAVDHIGGMIWTTYSPLPAIPEPTPRGNIVPLALLPEEPITVPTTPEDDPGEDPAPLPYPPGTGGNIPYAPVETDVNTGMGAIYNPTYAQIRQFSEYLWTDNFLEQFKKVFANPIDAVISLHKVYCKPKTASEPDNIYCGYVITPVTNVKKVSNRFTTVDCGRIYIPSYYESARDVLFSDLKVYLPFCGIMTVDIAEFVGAYMHVYYNVDVLTGTCAAFIAKPMGHNKEKILYTYSGNCAMSIPLSSGSYLSGFQGLLSAGASLLSGNVLGAISGVTSSIGVDIQRSGNLSANAGAMSPRRPYALITRKIPNEYDRLPSQQGYASNIPYDDIKTFLANHAEGSRATINNFMPVVAAGYNPVPGELEELKTILANGIVL